MEKHSGQFLKAEKINNSVLNKYNTLLWVAGLTLSLFVILYLYSDESESSFKKTLNPIKGVISGIPRLSVPSNGGVTLHITIDCILIDNCMKNIRIGDTALDLLKDKGFSTTSMNKADTIDAVIGESGGICGMSLNSVQLFSVDEFIAHQKKDRKFIYLLWFLSLLYFVKYRYTPFMKETKTPRRH